MMLPQQDILNMIKLSKVPQLGYWVGMLQGIDKYYREFIVCQRINPQHQLKLH